MAIIQNALDAAGNANPNVFAGNSTVTANSSGTPNSNPGMVDSSGISDSSNIPGYNPAKVNATLGAVNFGSDTVEGRTANILKSNSPLMERATGLANQRSNERGLINSSIGTGAAQTAVLDAAVPIAQVDAATMNTQRLQNQQTMNQNNQFNADAINVGQKMQYGAKLDSDKLNQSFNLDQQKQNSMFAQQQSTINLQSQLELQRLDKQFALQTQQQLTTLKAQEASQKQTSNYNAALQVSNNLVAEINRINADANFDAGAKAAQVQAAKSAATAQVNFLSRLSGQDYPMLQDYFNTINGVSVGPPVNFNDGQPHPAPFNMLSFQSAPPNYGEAG